MRKRILSTLACSFIAMVLLLGLPYNAWASDSTIPEIELTHHVTSNPETGYSIYLDDWADLLTLEEEDALVETMEPITAYGNVAFVSIADNPEYSSQRYAQKYYQEHFGYDSGIVFLVDMDERYLWIHSNGAIYKTVTTSYANTITDNVYSYASDEDYLTCASIAFEQVNTLLEGRRIAQPMKYISNALLAIVSALMINYFLVMTRSRSQKASAGQLLNGIFSKVAITNTHTDFVNQSRRYSPRSSSSSSSGSRSGGGGGGGRSSGGGGGHRF